LGEKQTKNNNKKQKKNGKRHYFAVRDVTRFGSRAPETFFFPFFLIREHTVTSEISLMVSEIKLIFSKILLIFSEVSLT